MTKQDEIIKLLKEIRTELKKIEKHVCDSDDIEITGGTFICKSLDELAAEKLENGFETNNIR